VSGLGLCADFYDSVKTKGIPMCVATIKRGLRKRLLAPLLCTGLLISLVTATVTAQNRDDHLDIFVYGLEMEGNLSGYFSSVTGIGSESEVVEHKVVDDKTGQTIVRKLPGRLEWTEITLRRGFTANLSIWQWRQQVVDGNLETARLNASIIAFNRSNQIVARWELFNTWPKKLVMQTGDQNQMVEELILVSEGFIREEVSIPDVCIPDSDGDGDTDGKDLANLITAFKPECLEPFADAFGQ
jgi:phage tail-like protein